MFIIRNTAVDDRVAGAHFRCNVRACKGACCTLEGGRGAPISEEERGELEAAFPIVRDLLSEEHREVIARDGLYEGPPGNRTTVCVNNRACVFAFFEEGIARCSFERAFESGKISWRKPLSCHLFPLRIRQSGKEVIEYEELSECEDARKQGEASGTKLADFLELPLVRHYGRGWYQELRKQCVDHESSPENG